MKLRNYIDSGESSDLFGRSQLWLCREIAPESSMPGVLSRYDCLEVSLGRRGWVLSDIG